MLNDCDLALWYCFAKPDSKRFSLIFNWDLRCSGSMEVGLYSTSRHLSNKIVCTCNKTILIGRSMKSGTEHTLNYGKLTRNRGYLDNFC